MMIMIMARPITTAMPSAEPGPINAPTPMTGNILLVRGDPDPYDQRRGQVARKGVMSPAPVARAESWNRRVDPICWKLLTIAAAQLCP